ncbi:hypothetical protein [Nonomuraea dietziae]|uniref:hypothetical protein n=1 Tax=Nonomuraea dietziae TaxID=65515 RepID=UPI00342911DE
MGKTRTRPVMDADPSRTVSRPVDYVWAIARISIGWVFLWAFLGMAFGWGSATPTGHARIDGGSPTSVFLTESDFEALAGQPWVDWLFMAGLLGVGLALMLGIGTRIAAAIGGLLLLMLAVGLPVAGSPFGYIVYAIVLIGLAMANAGETLGLGKLVHNPFLK